MTFHDRPDPCRDLGDIWDIHVPPHGMAALSKLHLHSLLNLSQSSKSNPAHQASVLHSHVLELSIEFIIWSVTAATPD